MSHGAEHHMEHAEHAVHASHDEFNKRVTMSIAIVAAVLACVTMLGHRAHNETLLHQGEALRIQGEALRVQGDALRVQAEALQMQTLSTRESTNAANKWSYYQTKNLFHLESKITIDLLRVLTTNPDNPDELKKVRARYQDNVDKYDKKLPQIEADATKITEKSDEYMDRSKEKIAEVDKKMKESLDMMAKSEDAQKQSHEMHAKADRFDYGELGLQFGVVLCSLAILTKGRGFWIVGMASAAIGALIALTGQLGWFIGAAHH
jgi:Domain of unknown function (DUF4337)